MHGEENERMLYKRGGADEKENREERRAAVEGDADSGRRMLGDDA